ncbi:hypothetical protein OG239_02520 [Streptomyces sp. NBC_00868]|uniref:hypothetical protein n=1 Tax=unclassified Streptomyces TaxID=2593676 RepID=UPI003254F20F|nr:hypothetical protein OG239_02520 [Streptomyces sp. NBC_00868]
MGQHEEAERPARLAAQHGDPSALCSLAQQWEDEGEEEAAETMADLAAEHGETDLLADLAVLRVRRGNKPGAPAAPAAGRRNDLHRTAIVSVPEKHREVRRDTLANLIISMHRHIVPDARTSTRPP